MTIEEITNLMTIAHQAALTNQHDSRHPELKAAHEALHKYATERDATIARLRKALEPFARRIEEIKDVGMIAMDYAHTMDEYRNANAALSDTPQSEPLPGAVARTWADYPLEEDADTPQSKQDGTA